MPKCHLHVLCNASFQFMFCCSVQVQHKTTRFVPTNANRDGCLNKENIVWSVFTFRICVFWCNIHENKVLEIFLCKSIQRKSSLLGVYLGKLDYNDKKCEWANWWSKYGAFWAQREQSTKCFIIRLWIFLHNPSAVLVWNGFCFLLNNHALFWNQKLWIIFDEQF